MNIGKLKLKSSMHTIATHSHQPNIIRQKQEKNQLEKILDQKLKNKDKITSFQLFQGAGTITSSGTSLIGNNTKFKSQIQNGDFIIAQNPVLKTTQEKQVMVVLGDKSILLKNPFIDQITSFSKYKVQKKQKVEKGQDIAEQYKKKLQQIKKTKQITKDTVELRVKKGMWAYEKQKFDVGKNASREELLNIRAKHIKDKFCW